MTDTTTLAPCPFCGGNQTAAPHDTHRPGCYFLVLASVKASPDADVSWATDLIAAWNRRAPATAPTDEDLVLEARKIGGLFDDLAVNYQSDDIVRLARAILAKWGAPAPASGEVVAEPEHSLCNDPRLCCRSHPHADQGLHCQLREVAAWLRWHAATGKTPRAESMHDHAEQVDAVALALIAPPAQEARMPLSDAQKREMVAGYFSEDWAIENALHLLDDFERHGITAAQKETPC